MEQWVESLQGVNRPGFGAGDQNIDPGYISVCVEMRIEVWTPILVTGTVRRIIEDHRDNHATVPKLYPRACPA